MSATRITRDPARMQGVPWIRDTRISVSAVLEQMAAGRTVEDVVADHPQLDREDVLAALAFAAVSLGPDAAPEADFPARLRHSIEENREILDRLAD
jgi:uncharacterized protein (DUF433 family)